MIKPRKLEKGDTIALISPSSGLAGIFPHRLDNAIKFLKKEGYKIIEFDTTRKNKNWSSGTPEERAKDIMNAFLNPDVKAIIATIGGVTASQTLKHLNFEKIKNNPKIFCGYSDNSVLHYAFLTQADLVTFYGPCAMTQFGEFPEPFDYTMKYFYKAITSNKPIGEIEPSKEWTDETLDWNKKLDLTGKRKMILNKGFEWLKEGEAKGKIIGGCISSIVRLAGTKYWPEYNNRILFLEIPEGQNFDKGEPLSYIDSYLTQLEILGVFDQINGLIFGRPFKYSNEDKGKLKEILLERTKDYNFPILFGADIGHTDPMVTIPLNTEVMINSEKNKFEFLEAGVI